MITSYKRVHIPYFCELCGKESFEGVAWGREVSRQVYQSSPKAGMVCDHCKTPPKIAGAAGPAPSWALAPLTK